MREIKINKQFTNRHDKSLDKYLTEISRITAISTDEEVQLSIRIREGDKNSLHRLVTANLRFVVSVSKQYQNQGLSLGDLINEGNFGLIKAAKRFDETRGFKFISYAVWWIRQSILQALADQSRTIRLPLSTSTNLGKIQSIAEKLEQEKEREPTDTEIAEMLNMSEIEVSQALNLHKKNKYVSLHEEIPGQENILRLDTISSGETADNIMIEESFQKDLDRVITSLKNPREEKVIRHFFGITNHKEMSIYRLSEELCVTSESIHQILKRALNRLQKKEKSKILRKYLN